MLQTRLLIGKSIWGPKYQAEVHLAKEREG